LVEWAQERHKNKDDKIHENIVKQQHENIVKQQHENIVKQQHENIVKQQHENIVNRLLRGRYDNSREKTGGIAGSAATGSNRQRRAVIVSQ
jgi:hypothetical protein